MSGPDTRSDIERGGSGDRDPITSLATSLVEIFKEEHEFAAQIHLDRTHPEMPALLERLYSYGVFGGSESILTDPMIFQYDKARGLTVEYDKLSLLMPTLPPRPAAVSLVVSSGNSPAICFRLVSIQRIEQTSQLIFVQMLGVSMMQGVPVAFRSAECQRSYAGRRGPITETIAGGDWREQTTPERAALICNLAKSAVQRMAEI